METPRCPGQNLRFWKPEDIFEVACPACGRAIEFFKDDAFRPCTCGVRVRNPRKDMGCAEWCKSANECLDVKAADAGTADDDDGSTRTLSTQDSAFCIHKENLAMSDARARLASKKLMLSDGAWGTQLQQRGLKPGQEPDSWNLDNPGPVKEVASAYVGAGSDVILTNTFGASRIQLSRHGQESRTADINTAGVQISKQAAGAKAAVFASIGPCGKMMMMGEVSADEVLAAFAEQANAIKAGGADGIVVETMTDLAEAELAVKAAVATGLPVVASFTFDSGPDHTRTMMGVTPEQVVEKLGPLGVAVVGANCGIGIDNYITVAGKYRAAWKGPVWIKANAGQPVMVDGKATYTMKPEVFAEQALKLVDAGATIVGGCCGTSPAFIAALKKRFTAAGLFKA
ncbi:MAG: hypothetical protein BIFFINMI_04346 [Phycisphaerae bacterium]|nr:hypothetical protein [Phycisphaerae bacterium]